jgi:hypothetical protein
MIQRVFGEPSWGNRLIIENQRGLTPLVWNHMNPYGQFRLDRNTRLVLAEVQAAVREVTTLHFLTRVLTLVANSILYLLKPVRAGGRPSESAASWLVTCWSTSLRSALS